jgi:2-keto-4-pentenoate hydratase/2-oxohepta-3-ene-1,7-dioic acid hydratase in catechol pathway
VKLVTFTEGGYSRIGGVTAEGIVDLSSQDSNLPTDMLTFLERGKPAIELARSICASGKGTLDLNNVILEAPIGRPPKILAIGLNYADHTEKSGFDLPENPIVFNKQSTSVTGPNGDIYLPPESEQLDYEGELAIVIGQRCRRISRRQAIDVIAGYTIVNDVSLRDWQSRSATITMGKSWDTCCPMGPYIVTSDEVGDPHCLSLKTWVNGQLRQDSNTSKMIFNCYDIVEYLSTAFTLEPGDVIATGTPDGVILEMQSKVWLKSGDVVRISIDQLGTIENRIINDPVNKTC